MAEIRLSKQGWCIIIISLTVLLLYYMSGMNRVDHLRGNVISMRHLLGKCVHLAEDSGYVIRTSYDADKLNSRVKAKSGSGPKNELLTDMDLQSHRVIVSGLNAAFPDIKVISEEHPPISSVYSPSAESMRSHSDVEGRLPDTDLYVPVSDITIWVDPLDATQELTEGLLEYVTVMVCVALHGFPIIGVVHQPFLNYTFWAWDSHAISVDLAHALQNGTIALRQQQQVVGTDKKQSDAEGPLVITHSRSHLDGSQFSQVFDKQTTKSIPAGGSGYKVLSLIQGKAQLYIHPAGTRRWDVCAAQAILEACGGRMTGLDGSRLVYNAKEGERVPETIGLFAAASTPLYDRWLPVASKLLKKP